ncbi:MAG: hypothetical protein KDH90_22255, partial [Anaerolineae bacterium]|nr:hypothetical protein [Anaerolineae bacterium]
MKATLEPELADSGADGDASAVCHDCAVAVAVPVGAGGDQSSTTALAPAGGLELSIGNTKPTAPARTTTIPIK